MYLFTSDYLTFYENADFYAASASCGADEINYRRMINPRTDTLSFRLTAGNLFQCCASSLPLRPHEKIENREESTCCEVYSET